jgi:cation diffusion facilitator CzcD-associated flavoprotein CzcO
MITGWAGLASAKTYQQLHPGRSVVILDQNATLGGTWAKERLYPGLKTNNLVGPLQYPDFPLVPEEFGIEKGQHIPGQVVHDYLSQYADKFGIADKDPIWSQGHHRRAT